MSKNDSKMEVLFRAGHFGKPFLEASWSLLGPRCDSGVLQGAKMSPRGLQNDPKIIQKWSQEGHKITLGSHLAFKLVDLKQGRRVPRSG